MADRGRPPKPRDVKIFEGNRSKRDLDYVEPVASGLPIKPVDLDGMAAELWDRLIDSLVAYGAGESDSDRIAGMCRWWALYKHYTSLLPGAEKEFSTLIMSATCWKQFEGLASKFGLSPADRAKLGHKPAEKDAVDEQYLTSHA